MDAQLKRGFLDICVLAAIARKDSYGYQIIRDAGAFLLIGGVSILIIPIVARCTTDFFLLSLYESAYYCVYVTQLTQLIHTDIRKYPDSTLRIRNDREQHIELLRDHLIFGF